MKVQHVLTTALCAVTLLLPVQAQIPGTLAYQGMLSDSEGKPKPDGSYAFSFRLYDAATGGTALWTETKDLDVDQGLFYTQLGYKTAFPATLHFDKPYWLGIQLGSEAELTPRIALASVGYSFTALRADSARHATRADTAQVATSALAAADLADNVVTSTKIQDGSIQRADVALTFKAPFADSSDHALSADTSDFALAAVAGGNAGGDLTGTYPAPIIADGAVNSAKIADGAVITADLADQAVTTAKIDATSAASGQALVYDGANLGWGAPTVVIPEASIDLTQLAFDPATQAELDASIAAAGDGYSLDADDGDPVDAVYVDNLGNVGIGKNNPSTTLDVNGTVTADDLDVSSTVSVGGSLSVGGGHVVNVRTVGPSDITSTSDRVVMYAFSNDDVIETITLHDSGDSPGQLLSIRLKMVAGYEYVEIYPGTNDTIDGLEFFITLDDGGIVGVTLVSDGTGWWIVSTAQQLVTLGEVPN